jgi:arginase
MTIISVPYHLDEYLPDLDLPLQPDQVVTAGLPAGDPWERMAVLQSAVAGTVAGEVASGARPELTAYRPELIAARLGLRPVPEDRIVLAGARDLDPPEVTYLAGAQITRREVAGLSAAGLPDGPLYVHVDLDVIDAARLPGLRYPAPGGPDAAQLADALRVLLATGQVAALGISCSWYPGHAAAQHVAAQLSAALE